MAEEINIGEDGYIEQVESTSCGLNGGPLVGHGTYPAYIACNLRSGRILGINMPFAGPYMTQEGEDREDNPNQYVKNITPGSLVGYKYFQMDGGTQKLSVTLRGQAEGILHIRTEEKGKDIGRIKINLHTESWQTVSGSIEVCEGKQALYFLYHGKGRFDMCEFTFMEGKGTLSET